MYKYPRIIIEKKWLLEHSPIQKKKSAQGQGST